jgi:hypothetical protein
MPDSEYAVEYIPLSGNDGKQILRVQKEIPAISYRAPKLFEVTSKSQSRLHIFRQIFSSKIALLGLGALLLRLSSAIMACHSAGSTQLY